MKTSSESDRSVSTARSVWLPSAIVAVASVLIGRIATTDPESVLGIALAAFWISLLWLSLYRSSRRTLADRWLSRMVIAGLWFRVPMVVAHLAVGFVIYRGQLDFPGYFASAVGQGRNLLAGGLYGFFLPELSASQVLHRLSALSYLVVGPSLAGLFFLSGVLGFLGSYLFLRAFLMEFPSSREARFVAGVLFFFPSLAFWTSLLGKDSWMYFFLGAVSHFMARILRAPRLRDVVGLAVGLGFITIIRPPVGFVLTAVGGSCVIVALHSQLSKGPAAILRPVAYVVIGVVLLGTVSVAMSSLRSYGKLTDQTGVAEGLLTLAVQKHVGLSTDPTARGSSQAISISAPTTPEAIRFLPAAMLTFLFRPLVFEAHNMLALVAALDGSLLLCIVVWRLRHLLRAVRLAFARPFVLFCAGAFLLMTAGLSFESNFGVVVRHRTMVLPFLFILLAVPLRPKKARSPALAGYQDPCGPGAPLPDERSHQS